MSYDKLLAELDEEMRKALPTGGDEDDKQILSAAGEDDVNKDGGLVRTGERKEDDDDDDDEDDGMTKSFQITLEDGTTIDAVDGAQMVKALGARVDAAEAELKKAADFSAAAVALIKKQGDMIKSLSEQIQKVGGEGRGRRAVVSVTEKPAPGATMAKGAENGISAADFMAKAVDAMNSGRLTAGDVARAEAYLNRGHPVPEAIVKRVFE